MATWRRGAALAAGREPPQPDVTAINEHSGTRWTRLLDIVYRVRMANYVENPDPRSYQAACDRAVVADAERIVLRAEHGPTPHEQFMKKLFEALDPSREEGQQ